MRVEKDYEELFKLFNRHRVKYCIIGSYAVAFYARPRYTKDIDILIETRDRGHGALIKDQLAAAGFAVGLGSDVGLHSAPA